MKAAKQNGNGNMKSGESEMWRNGENGRQSKGHRNGIENGVAMAKRSKRHRNGIVAINNNGESVA
jgi:hypothetical protein